MGFADLEKPKELWTSVVTKDGKTLDYIKEVTDLVRFDAEEHELSTLLYDKLNAWLSASPANKAKLKDFKEGFKFVHTDGMTYKVVEGNSGKIKISKWRAKGSGSGGGGFAKSNYVHLRNEETKLVHFEELHATINNQGPNDNWYVYPIEKDQVGPLFLMMNQKPYTPKVEPSEETGKEEETSSEE